MLTSTVGYPGFSIRIHVQEHVVSGVQAVMVHVVCRSGTFLGLLVERERARVRERNSPPTPVRALAPRAFRKVYASTPMHVTTCTPTAGGSRR